MKPTLLIAGAGQVGTHLATRMCHAWRVIVVDDSEERLAQEALAHCETHQGDVTSALVLQKANIEQAQAVVATGRSDEINFEVLRVARERFDVEKRYTVLGRSDWAERYADQDVELLDRAHACAVQIESRILSGRKVAVNIGLGAGEIMEVEVLGNSSVIGTALRDLKPRRWIVGAIYRDGELIVPHGDTTIAKGDRIVVIGDPEILPAIATHIGVGESEFPLHYGSAIAVLGAEGLRAMEHELRYLLDQTAADEMKVLYCEAEDGQIADRFRDDAGLPLKTIRVLRATAQRELAQAAEDRDVGLVLLPPRKLSWPQRIGLTKSFTAKLVDKLRAPVMISRGTVPYRRVMLVLADMSFHMDAAQLAIDLVRMVGAQLDLGVVHQPELVVGEQLRQEMEEKRRQIVNLAQMYHVPVQVVEMEGNPIAEIAERSVDYQVVVLAHKRGRRVSLSRPDVSQNVAHKVACTTLLMPHE